MAPAPAPAIRSILVLCEGNHCRSPIAEALLRTALGPSIRVESAGLGALAGVPAAEPAQELMRARGQDIGSHRGRQLTPALALSADLLLVMTFAQKLATEALVPSARGRVYLLGHWLSEDQQEVADPFQLGSEAYRLALQHIDRAIAAWLPRLAPTTGNA